jgi:hypothetical protein
MNKKVKKLVLTRETLRALNSSTLQHAAGGTWTEGTECTTFILTTCGDAGSNNCGTAATCYCCSRPCDTANPCTTSC